MLETTLYELEVEFLTPLLGTQGQKDVAQQFWLEKARAAGLDVEDEEETLPEMLERGTTAFHKLDGAPILYNFAVKGALKEAGTTFNGLRGVRNLRSKIERLVFVSPRRIPLILPEGAEIEFEDRPLRGMTKQGPRISLIRSERLPEGTRLKCRLKVYAGPISEDLLRDLMSYWVDQGLGQWRNGGWGTAKATLTRVAE